MACLSWKKAHGNFILFPAVPESEPRCCSFVLIVVSIIRGRVRGRREVEDGRKRRQEGEKGRGRNRG